MAALEAYAPLIPEVILVVGALALIGLMILCAGAALAR